MSILLKWKIPTDPDITYDKTYIYRSTSQLGVYTEITNQAIADNSYFDIDGGANNWYKIRYFNSSSSKWSEYSDPMQGGTFRGYCTPDDVRLISGLTTTNINDTYLAELIEYSTAQINSDINISVIREKVEWIDDTRENDIDGSNTIFYVQNWKDYFIADYDNDGNIDIGDVITYKVASDGTETTTTVSSITASAGKFVLETAPESEYDLYVTYAYSPVLEDPPHPLVKLAAAQLAASLAYTKIDVTKIQSFTVGKIKVAKQSQAFQQFYDQYRQTIHKINTHPIQKIEGKSVV